jgi:F-type H+-transporting ATPase subunit b
MKTLRILLVILIAVCLLAPAVASAQTNQDAEEAPSLFRTIWDTAWRFINFFILVYVIVRFGRKPLKDFISQQAEQKESEIRQAQAMKAQAQADYQEAETKLADMESTIRDLEKHMYESAERLKRDMLAEAEQNARQILDSSKEVAASKMRTAQANLKREMAEMVIAEAEKIIRQHISEDDQDRLIDEYVTQLRPQGESA